MRRKRRKNRKRKNKDRKNEKKKTGKTQKMKKQFNPSKETKKKKKKKRKKGKGRGRIERATEKGVEGNREEEEGEYKGRRRGTNHFLYFVFVITAQEGEGTYGGIVYSYFTPTIWDFDAAQAYCESYTANSGGLAELTSEDIKTFVNNLITGNHEMWIGSKKVTINYSLLFYNSPCIF